MAQLKSGSTVGGSGIVTKGDNQALHDTDALRISGSTVYLYKGDGTNESVTLPSSTPTTTQVGSAAAGLAVYAVGSYILARYNTVAEKYPGTTLAGSSLRACSVDNVITGGGLSGTWRCMGFSSVYIDDDTFSSDRPHGTLWLRIS
jgi:hypothetical protein